MAFPKAMVLILSAVSAVSAEFPPRTSDVGSAVKDMFQNVFNGRRLAGAMSPECASACDGVEDFIKLYTENMEAVGKGDMSWMCGSMSAAKCMGSEGACQDDGKPKEDNSDMESIECMCTCPVVGRLQKMAPKEYCDPANSMDCLFTTAACSTIKKSMIQGGSDADFKKGISLHCQQMDLGCEEKGAGVMKCAGDDLTSWMTEGCDDAAKSGTLASKSSDCCSHGEKVVKCMDAQCIKLGALATKLSAKADKEMSAADKKEMQAEMDKNYEIGKVCPGTGMPTSDADLEAADADNAAASSAFASVLHAIPFVVMVGGLLA